MAEHDQESRIRDLKLRVEREPRSRFFVPLAEELRKAGRLPEAVRVLEEGLAAHPAYVAARVALARALLEAGRIEDSVAAFSKVLADDPSNLVAAKALGDIHLSRGEPTEALKRYLRFRAVSGDRRLDDVISRLREEIAPPPEAAPSAVAPPPAFAPAIPPGGVSVVTEPPPIVSPLGPVELWPDPPTRRETDPFDITSVPYSRPPEPEAPASEPAEEMLSRDVRLDELPSRKSAESAETCRPAIRLPETSWPFEPEAEAPEAPSGRTLAELYLGQGHYAEAIRLAEEILAASPGDPDLLRLRDESRERAAGAPPAVPPSAPDPGRERRLAKIGVLNEWLDRVQARSRP